MDKVEFDKLGLKIGQKIDLKMKSLSPTNVIFDGIREYNEYGVSETYILYHRIEAVKLDEIIKISSMDAGSNENNSDEKKIDGNQEQNTSTHAQETEESNTKPQVEGKYICSCGKSYANAGALWNHTKKTGHKRT